MPLSLGFIGAGNINRVHMKDAQQLGMNLAAAADVAPASLEQVKTTFGIAKTYTDYREMLRDKSIDAVVIGTPNKFHAAQAIAALQAGKHVYLEKPMAMNVGESDAILAALKKSRKILQMGMSNRFSGASQALKDYIDAGGCGNIYAGQSWWFRRRGIPGFGGWFTTKSMSGGGALIDIGVHMLDLAVYLMGFPKPVAVSGMTYNIWKNLENYTYVGMWGKPTPGGKKDVDDYALALIRFVEGQTLQLNVSWALNVDFMQPEQGVRLMGDKGGVELKGMDQPFAYTEQAGHLVDVKLHFKAAPNHTQTMAHFVECVQGNRQPLATAQQGRTIQSILDAIYESGKTGKEVRLK